MVIFKSHHDTVEAAEEAGHGAEEQIPDAASAGL